MPETRGTFPKQEPMDELDHEGNSPLLLAVREGHAPSVQLLVKAGVDSGLRVETDLDYTYFDAEETDDWAALDFAASAGRVDLCKSLVEGGADVNATSNGCSRIPLHAAAGSNQVEAIDALIELGAEVEGGPGVGYDTPVEIAAKTGSLEAVAALARHGAALNTALKRATTMSELRVVVALIEAGADPNGSDSDGDTPLHYAVRFWPRQEVSRALLRHGATVDAPGDLGRTPLHVAASEGRECREGQSAIDFFLEEAGEEGLGWRDEDGLTPLHVACQDSNRYAVAALLRRGADITAQDHGGDSPLHLAVASKGVVGILLRAGAHAGAVNADGSTALHLACSNRSSAVAAALVEHDPALVNARNLNGETPLHAAAAAAEEEGPVARWRARDCAQAPTIVDMLLRGGADESLEDNVGCPPSLSPVLKSLAYGRSGVSLSTERVCVIIRRAPADRAWRRRGILLLCRAFSEKAQLEPDGGRAKVARVSDGGGAADGGGKGRRTVNGRAGCAGDLANLVARLFDLPEEGIFRKIICFL